MVGFGGSSQRTPPINAVSSSHLPGNGLKYSDVLEDGAWVEPLEALPKRKSILKWIAENVNVARKLIVEDGWTQKRLYDIGWSDEKMCKGSDKEEGTEKHRLYHCPSWREVRNQIPGELENWEQRAGTSNGGIGRNEQQRRRKTGSGKEVSRRTS